MTEDQIRKKNEEISLINDLTTYVYGIYFLAFVACIMLFIHLYIAFVFHDA